MKSLKDYALNKEYERLAKLSDKLAVVGKLIDWKCFRSIVRGMFDNQTRHGGRPNMDEMLMIKLLVLQAWHGLSDPELERQVADHISFRKFLGYPSILWRTISGLTSYVYYNWNTSCRHRFSLL